MYEEFTDFSFVERFAMPVPSTRMMAGAFGGQPMAFPGQPSATPALKAPNSPHGFDRGESSVGADLQVAICLQGEREQSITLILLRAPDRQGGGSLCLRIDRNKPILDQNQSQVQVLEV